MFVKRTYAKFSFAYVKTQKVKYICSNITTRTHIISTVHKRST